MKKENDNIYDPTKHFGVFAPVQCDLLSVCEELVRQCHDDLYDTWVTPDLLEQITTKIKDIKNENS